MSDFSDDSDAPAEELEQEEADEEAAAARAARGAPARCAGARAAHALTLRSGRAEAPARGGCGSYPVRQHRGASGRRLGAALRSRALGARAAPRRLRPSLTRPRAQAGASGGAAGGGPILARSRTAAKRVADERAERLRLKAARRHKREARWPLRPFWAALTLVTERCATPGEVRSLLEW